MPRSSRSFAVLLLVLLLVPAALQAAEPQRNVEPLQNRSAALSAWDELARLWSVLTGSQTDNGCILDPSGGCLPRQGATSGFDNGCILEPDGGCRR